MLQKLKFFFSKLWQKLYSRKRGEKKRLNAFRSNLSLLSRLPVHEKHAAKGVLVIRVDDIGDYVLFRNSLWEIRHSKKYKNREIFLLGNQAWRELFEQFDAALADSVIWLNKGRFFADREYKMELFRELRKLPVSELLVPAYTRYSYLEDSLALAVGADIRHAWAKKSEGLEAEEKELANAIYNRIISDDRRPLHESERNHLFAETVCGEVIPQRKVTIERSLLPDYNPQPENYVILFPGGSAGSKRWNPTCFALLADHVSSKGIIPLIAGSYSDNYFASAILKASAAPKKILNFCGKTSLAELATLISKCRLLVSNDTCAPHMAAALGVPAFVPANGNNYMRFFPYPPAYENIHAFYPRSYSAEMHYNFQGKGNIQSITADTLIAAIQQYLQ